MKYLRWLLFPFSLLYGVVVILRNWCYDAGLFKSYKFDLAVISVGNLEVGGAGKSPMAEYLIQLFKNSYKIATLSRGYGRKTKGFLIATATTTALDLGDEPAQFKHKFPGITVAVCEKRVYGIQQLQKDNDIFILDDAYQHRAVNPGLSILLFDHSRLKEPHLLLPTGNYREPFWGRWRANIIIISKCPPQLSREEQVAIFNDISPMPDQQLFFSSIDYMPFQNRNGENIAAKIDAETTVFLLTGIANPQPLVNHVNEFTPNIIHHNYPDHHQFTLKNISKLAAEFSACTVQKKMIITTEKDAQRLKGPGLLPLVNTLPIFIIPIGIKFLNNGQEAFDTSLNAYVGKYNRNS